MYKKLNFLVMYLPTVILTWTTEKYFSTQRLLDVYPWVFKKHHILAKAIYSYSQQPPKDRSIRIPSTCKKKKKKQKLITMEGAFSWISKFVTNKIYSQHSVIKTISRTKFWKYKNLLNLNGHHQRIPKPI